MLSRTVRSTITRRIGGACVARKRIARNFGFLIKKVIRKLNESFTQQPRALWTERGAWKEGGN